MILEKCYIAAKLESLSQLKKLKELFFPGKFIFAKIWVKRAQNGPKIGSFWIFKKILSLVLFGNIKWKLILQLIFHHQSHILQNSSSWYCQPVKLQNSLKCNVSRKKWMMKFVFCRQINIKVLKQVDTIIFGVCNQVCPKYPK